MPIRLSANGRGRCSQRQCLQKFIRGLECAHRDRHSAIAVPVRVTTFIKDLVKLADRTFCLLTEDVGTLQLPPRFLPLSINKSRYFARATRGHSSILTKRYRSHF